MVQLIRERHIDALMATSLINDSGYAKDACVNLIDAAQIIFGAQQSLQLAAEQRVALDDTEIEQIAQNSKTL